MQDILTRSIHWMNRPAVRGGIFPPGQCLRSVPYYDHEVKNTEKDELQGQDPETRSWTMSTMISVCDRECRLNDGAQHQPLYRRQPGVQMGPLRGSWQKYHYNNNERAASSSIWHGASADG